MTVANTLKNIEPLTLKRLNEKSNAWGFWLIIFNYLLIGFSFALVWYFPHALSILVAIIILGGRQLGLAILMHDCSHHSLFKRREFNNFFGQWLCAAPIMADLDKYRTYHLKHHRTAGSEEDPDRSNYKSYPVTKASMKRKIFRDLLGITGFKTLSLIFLMNAGALTYQLSYDAVPEKGAHASWAKKFLTAMKNLAPSLVYHLVLFSLISYFTHPFLYLLWPVSWLTSYMLFARIRNAAEHGATINIHDLNPLLNTRTTYATWWERLCVAPNYVNYHLEHHLLPSVPSFRLSRFHQELKNTQALKDADISSGYIEVLCKLTSKKA